jgi:hypothetical protein
MKHPMSMDEFKESARVFRHMHIERVAKQNRRYDMPKKTTDFKHKTKGEVQLMKRLDDLKPFPVKWTVVYGARCGDIAPNYTYAGLRVLDRFYIGEAVMSDKDHFDRKIARVIALGRAYRHYREGQSVPKCEVPKILMRNLLYSCEKPKRVSPMRVSRKIALARSKKRGKRAGSKSRRKKA